MNYLKRIKTTNHIKHAREALMPFIKRLCQKKEVIGVVLLGGVANTKYRGYIDEFSDLDLAIFLDIPESQHCKDVKKFCAENQHLFPKWLPEFCFYLPIPSINTRMELNVHQLMYQYETKEDVQWSDSKKEAYLYTGEIIYDPLNKISELIYKKATMSKEIRWKKIITLAGQKKWNIDINPIRQIHRGFIMNSHDLLNKGLDQFIECLYLYNWRYKPHTKWLLEMVQDLEWTPKNFKERLQEALLILNHDSEDIYRRVKVISSLWNELLEQLKYEGLPKDPFYYTSVYIDSERQLLERTTADELSEKLQLEEEIDASQVKDFINYLLIEDLDELNTTISNNKLLLEIKDKFKEEINIILGNTLIEK